MDDQLTMAPAPVPFASMARTPCFMPKITPRTWMSIMRSYFSWVTSTRSCGSEIPATFNMASRRPNSSTAAATMAAMSSSLVTSQWNGSTPSPASAAVSFSAPLMSAATTRAPSRTKAFTDAFAIPEPAPVMTATLPSSCPTVPPRSRRVPLRRPDP